MHKKKNSIPSTWDLSFLVPERFVLTDFQSEDSWGWARNLHEEELWDLASAFAYLTVWYAA